MAQAVTLERYLLPRASEQTRKKQLRLKEVYRIVGKEPEVLTPSRSESLAKGLIEVGRWIQKGRSGCYEMEGLRPGESKELARMLEKDFPRKRHGAVITDWMPEAMSIWDWLSAGRARSTKEVMSASKALGADRWIETLPMGPNTVLHNPTASFKEHELALLMLSTFLMAPPDICVWKLSQETPDTTIQVIINRALEQHSIIVLCREYCQA